MKKFISSLKAQIYVDPLLSVLILTLFIVIFIIGFVGSIAILVKTFMLLLSDVPTFKIL